MKRLVNGAIKNYLLEEYEIRTYDGICTNAREAILSGLTMNGVVNVS